MNKTADTLASLKKEEASLRFIHYSCETLADGNDGLSPRITSIAVVNAESGATHSFSIHLVAERQGVLKEKIAERYNDLEATMLDEFYDFVQSQQSPIWIHWNMHDVNFGFEALAHRYQVLRRISPPNIPDSRRHNLSKLIAGIYGWNYVPDPKMKNLMAQNGGLPRTFLSGAEEAESFKVGEFVKLHKSTMGKAYRFQTIYHLLQKRKLVTRISRFWLRVNELIETPQMKLLGVVLVFIGLIEVLGEKIPEALAIVAGWMGW